MIKKISFKFISVGFSLLFFFHNYNYSNSQKIKFRGLFSLNISNEKINELLSRTISYSSEKAVETKLPYLNFKIQANLSQLIQPKKFLKATDLKKSLKEIENVLFQNFFEHIYNGDITALLEEINNKDRIDTFYNNEELFKEFINEGNSNSKDNNEESELQNMISEATVNTIRQKLSEQLLSNNYTGMTISKCTINLMNVVYIYPIHTIKFGDKLYCYCIQSLFEKKDLTETNKKQGANVENICHVEYICMEKNKIAVTTNAIASSYFLHFILNSAYFSYHFRYTTIIAFIEEQTRSKLSQKQLVLLKTLLDLQISIRSILLSDNPIGAARFLFESASAFAYKFALIAKENNTNMYWALEYMAICRKKVFRFVLHTLEQYFDANDINKFYSYLYAIKKNIFMPLPPKRFF